MANTKVNTGYIQNLVSDFRSTISANTEIVDVISFTEAAWGLDFELFPMQRFILKTFYGLPLDDTEKKIPLPDELNQKTLGWFTEKEMMDFLIETKKTNITEYVPGQAKRELILCCGRRASKTNITSIVCGYEAYRMIKLGNPQAYFGFPEGNEIDITTVATVDEQASILYGMIKNRVLASTFFNGRLETDTKVYFSLKTDQDISTDREASLRVYCGGASSKALRGRNNLVVVIDEAAHFDNVGPGSLPVCYQAVSPSVASFVPKGKKNGEGKIIMLSSPLSKSGMFWEKCQEAYDYPEDMLLFQMYSSMINIRLDPAFLRSEQRKNKELFRCEYGGEFSDTISSWCSPDLLDKVVDHGRKTNRNKGLSGVNYYMGIDYGGKNDGTSIAICHKEDDRIVLDYADVFYSSTSDVWSSSVGYYKECNRIFADQDVIPLNKLADHIKKLCEQFNIVKGWFDQYNGYGLLELLKERGLGDKFEMKVVSQQLNIQTFQITKELINTEKLVLFDHPVLIPELASLEECKDGSSMVVQAPQRGGYHDDLSDALVRSIYSAYNDSAPTVRRITGGTGNLSRIGISGNSAWRNFQLKKAKMFGGQEYKDSLIYGRFRKW